MKCHICGTPLGDDLFSAVTGEKVCSICKLKFIGGLPTTDAQIKYVRDALGLKPGEYLVLPRAEEARKILGRG